VFDWYTRNRMHNPKVKLCDIIYRISSPAMNKSLHVGLVNICNSGGDPFSHIYDDMPSGKCCLPSPSFIAPNRWKSKGAKSGHYGGCGRTDQQNFAMCSMVFKLVRGLALSCCRRKVVFFSTLTLDIQACSLVSVAT
jgi:hypothetical protein